MKVLGEACDRCRGKGFVNDGSLRRATLCPVCLGLERFVRPPKKTYPEYHLVALHSPILDWDEVVAMLPVRKDADG